MKAVTDSKTEAKKSVVLDFAGFVELAKNKVSELVSALKKNAQLDACVEKAQKAFDGCKKQYAKQMAAFKVSHEAAKGRKDVSPDQPFAEYFESQVGVKPNTHVLAMATAFNRLVETGYCTEAVFDAQPNDAWEQANAAITAIIEKYRGTGTDPKDTPEFKAVVSALNSPGEAAKTIKDIKAKVRPSKRAKKDGEETPTAEPMVLRVPTTPAIALQLWEEIVTHNQQDVCFAQFKTQFSQLPAEAQKSTFLTLDSMMADIWAAVTVAKGDAWLAQRSEATAPVQMLAAGTPVANTPGKELQAA